MAAIPEKELGQLKAFCQLLKSQPALLWDPSLAFMRDTLASIGCTLPPKPAAKPEPTPAPAAEKAEEKVEEEEEEEEELPPLETPTFPEDAGKDDECIEGDDLSVYKEIPAKETVSEEDQESAMSLRSEAVELMQGGDFEKSIAKFTEALTLNPNMAPIWATRAQCYLKWKKLNSAVKDASEAIKLNPNQAKALRVRGQAGRKLGNWEDAAKDLHAANAIDFDPDMADMLKVVEAKAKKIADYHLACKRVEEEKKHRELLKKQKQYRKMREQEKKEAAKQAAEEASMGGMPGGMPDMGGMGGMPDFNDPEIMEMLQDPDVQAGKPEAILKYANNPKVAKMMEMMMGMKGGKGGGMPGMGGMGGMGGMPGMGGMGGMGGMPGMGGMGGMPGMGGKGGKGFGMGGKGAKPAEKPPAPKPTSADDLD